MGYEDVAWCKRCKKLTNIWVNNRLSSCIECGETWNQFHVKSPIEDAGEEARRLLQNFETNAQNELVSLRAKNESLKVKVEQLELERDLAWDVVHIVTDINATMRSELHGDREVD